MVRWMNRAYEFCKDSVGKKTTPKYVKKQMRLWMRIAEGKDRKYKVNEKKVKQIEEILKLLIMPKGPKAGQTLYECSCGYQWLFYIAILCTVYRNDEKKRRYEIGLLEICRKNFKTYTIATIFIILFLTEPPFSKFFSVAPDGTLSKEIKDAISETLQSSPKVYNYKRTKRFKICRDYIMFKLKQSQLIPLAFSNNRMDGRYPACWIADEVGALPTSYPIQAMKSGQVNMVNKLGFVISTKYPTIDNPFEAEVTYTKQMLDGRVKDDTLFALLYEPDKTKDWETDDLILKQANPVAVEDKEIYKDLLKKRARAIAVESDRENFVTKHCNIIYQGQGTETFIDVKYVQSCKVANIDWNGRIVYVGLDLSETNDNTSVAMVSVDDDNNILAESFAFIPEGRIEEKTATEKVPYRELIKKGKVFACGDLVVDYAVIEEFILDLEEKYGVQIQAIGYDRWNALSTAQKLEKAGYTLVEVKQHSSVLHPPTKLLRDSILSEKFRYTENRLLEINFQNARCVYDNNKNLYVNKKKSIGKVDMVVSTINATYLLQQDVFLGQMDFVAQVI